MGPGPQDGMRTARCVSVLSLVVAVLTLAAATTAPTVAGDPVAEAGPDIQDYTGRLVPIVLVHGERDRDVHIDADTSTLKASDALRNIFFAGGWTMNELLYFRLENVGHRWQPQLNQQVWDFLSNRPHEEAP